ncbi:MAG: substrate-binding domain-containing protein [Variibacter sp.]
MQTVDARSCEDSMAKSESPTGQRSIPRLADLAANLGVSIATVSRALSDNPGKISARQIMRIKAAAEELGYFPNGAARSLVSRHSRAVGIVVPTLGVDLFSAGVEVLQQRLHAANYTLLLANSLYDPNLELREVQTFVERGVDGIVLVGEARDAKVYELLQRCHIPYVNTYLYRQGSRHPCIGIDNYDAMYRLARMLVDLGHRRFAVVTGPLRHNDRATDRVNGVRACLNAHDIDLPATHVLEMRNSILDGGMAFRSLLSLKKLPTAIMCTNDTLGTGLLLEARRQGVAVPTDLSVTGFDNHAISAHLDPPLTTVEVSAKDLGVRIAEYILSRIEGRDCPEMSQLPGNLILRESIGKAPST